MNQHDISWTSLILGSLIFLIPIWIFYIYKTGLIRSTMIAIVRMAIQLFLVGLYLEVIFELNSILLNLAWVVVMIIAAGFVITSRSELSKKHIMFPLLIAIVINVIVNGAVYAFLIVGTDAIFYARYLIPIMGMVVGNSVNSTIIGLRKYFHSIKENEQQYIYMLMCGASQVEASFQFIRSALQEAFNPVIASTATIGLIWLPGMMTGQILGGSDPVIAIKYQIIIVISIFVGSVVTVYSTLKISKSFAFDNRDILRPEILKLKKN
jgi:putative ABC transport system permease protein